MNKLISTIIIAGLAGIVSATEINIAVPLTTITLTTTNVVEKSVSINSETHDFTITAQATLVGCGEISTNGATKEIKAFCLVSPITITGAEICIYNSVATNAFNTLNGLQIQTAYNDLRYQKITNVLSKPIN